MDIGSIFLILGLLLLVALYVGRPLMERRSTAVTEEEHELSALLAERDRILNALQELDFDYTLGKIPEEDYPAQRTMLLQKGANVLRSIDVHQNGVDGHRPEEEAEARIEAAIAARRAVAGSPPEAATARARSAPAAITQDDELEGMIAARRRVRQEKSAGFCPQCGGPVQKSDRFCPKCGTQLA